MRDPDTMTEAEKLDTLFGVGGAGPLPWTFGMEYQPKVRRTPSAMLAWYFVLLTLLLFPAVFVAVPLALRAARQGNRLAWLAAVLAIVAATASLVAIVSIRTRT